MNKTFLRMTRVAVLAAALPLFTACSTLETGDSTEPGAIVVETVQMTATVKAVDRRNRTVTLAGKNGKREKMCIRDRPCSPCPGCCGRSAGTPIA